MKIILQEDVSNLGKAGDVVNVADGFGRNYLFPRRLAVLADERNTRRLDHQKTVTAARQARALTAARDVAARIAATAITIKRQTSAEDKEKIFGSVTNQDIAEALAAYGLTVERCSIVLPEPIRNIGVHNVPVKLAPSIEATVKVYVIRA